ncbi:TorD/DmsD family molecular chaperone [Shewanella algae]|uniref:TorD/DmsD family molecular chaperone n=1 Tax=Shewanella algae TaxID=38313 RepID=UPI0005CCC580|nr:molecular chaperone TorD family protein [Shewanella algae]AYV12078.1 molecular chaperone TorD [Shewanella algae]MCE9775714.1 molecular chaperone TorD family protein [Shewanella algae]QGS61641.1 molecular chaperone TorD [Shewanella algae]QTE86925.1 molecular chaperone TorD family protein [Shewanella algae]TVK92295.1 molecular chaperone TorD [Shewanella algae]
MTDLDLGPVASGYQALKAMLFAPSSPESLKRLIDWLEQEQRYPELLQQAKQWQSEPLELECDFNRMCIGPTKLLVPPYESVYRDVGRQIHTDRTLEVADFYQQLGLVTDTGFNEPADYIGNELEFLFCAEALRHQQQNEDPAAADELEQLAQVFLEQHLGTWYQAFAQGISQHARLDFWRCYAQVLEDFLTSRLKNSGVETPTAKHH